MYIVIDCEVTGFTFSRFLVSSWLEMPCVISFSNVLIYASRQWTSVIPPHVATKPSYYPSICHSSQIPSKRMWQSMIFYSIDFLNLSNRKIMFSAVTIYQTGNLHLPWNVYGRNENKNWINFENNLKIFINENLWCWHNLRYMKAKNSHKNDRYLIFCSKWSSFVFVSQYYYLLLIFVFNDYQFFVKNTLLWLRTIFYQHKNLCEFFFRLTLTVQGWIVQKLVNIAKIQGAIYSLDENVIKG